MAVQMEDVMMDCYGAGKDGLNDGRVKVHHHGLWQIEHLQQP